MRGTGRLAGWALAASVAWSATAGAVHLDEDRNFRVTGTFYTQARFRLQDSQGPNGKQIQPYNTGGTALNTQAGNLVQWRNFAYPVFEGDVADALGWTFLEDLSFRFAGRFTYDGLWDFGPVEFKRMIRTYRASARQSPLGGTQPVPQFFGTKPVEANGDDAARTARLADMELFDPKEVFGRQADPWEIYFNFQKGGLFARIGKQNLSWGETDGLRLLDVINPIDNFFGLTFDEDLDEKRIPLWMVRANYQIINLWGPFSSVGLESFWVPGAIDTTQGPVPLQSFMHPYAPPAGCDAQLISDNSTAEPIVGNSQIPVGCNPVPGNPAAGQVNVSFYERLPEKTLSNSRYGARLVGVLLDRYTWSLGGYRTWADIPQPRVHYLDLDEGVVVPGELVVPGSVVVELTHGTEWIVGGTISFYQQMLLPGVVRAEIGYFFDEPAFVNILNQGDPFSGKIDTFVPTANYVRWMIGYDVFELNVPWLSRTNNIILITQWFNSLRLTDDKRYRQLAADANAGVTRNLPPALPDRPPPRDLTDDFGRFALTANPPRNNLGNLILPGVAKRYNGTWSVALQAFLWHGNLIPQIVGVAFTEGDFGFLPNVIYRFNDQLQVKLAYAGIYGKFSQLGLFRDRDQVGIRLTYLLN